MKIKNNLFFGLQIFIFIIPLLYFFGPIDWKSNNNLAIYLYFLLCQICLISGYFFVKKYKFSNSRTLKFNNKNIQVCLNVIYICSIIANIILILRAMNSFNLSKILSILFDPSTQYNEYQEISSQVVGGGVVNLFITFCQSLSVMGMIAGVYFYRKLIFTTKMLFIMTVIFEFLNALVNGTNEGIFNVIIFLCVPFYINMQRNKYKFNFKIKKLKQYKKYIILILVGVLFISFFTNNISGRTAENYALPTIKPNTFNKDSLLYNITPDFLQDTLVYSTVYLCEGIYGFSLAFKLPWVCTYGGGFSMFIRSNLESLLNVNLTAISFQGRAENIFGWGANRNWHTMYTWFANDVSFYFVPVIIFVIGFLFIKTYKDSLIKNNVFACILLTLLVMQILFIYSNNKVFALPSTCISFFVSLFLWIITRRYKFK